MARRRHWRGLQIQEADGFHDQPVQVVFKPFPELQKQLPGTRKPRSFLELGSGAGGRHPLQIEHCQYADDIPDAAASPGMSEAGKQGEGSAAMPAEKPPDKDLSLKPGNTEPPCIKTVALQQACLALRA